MSLLGSIFGSPEAKKDNVVLFVKIKFRDGTEGENRVVVARHDIEHKCREYASREDILEIWVYEKIFHDMKSDKSDGAHTGEAKSKSFFHGLAPAGAD